MHDTRPPRIAQRLEERTVGPRELTGQRQRAACNPASIGMSLVRGRALEPGAKGQVQRSRAPSEGQRLLLRCTHCIGVPLPARLQLARHCISSWLLQPYWKYPVTSMITWIVPDPGPTAFP